MAEEKAGEERSWPDGYDLHQDCSIRGSNLCWKFADSVGCSGCYLAADKKGKECSEAKQRWDETLALLPRDIDTLGCGSACLLCAADPEPADGYALLEMANEDPYYEKGIIFGYGKKVRSPVGSLVSVPIRVGRRCRRAFRMVECIQIVWPIITFLVSLLLLAVPQIGQPMSRVSPLLPVAFVVLLTVGGYYLGRNLSLWYVEKHADEVRFDLSRIPLIRAMLGRGWYYFQVNHGLPRLTFTKKKPVERLFPPMQAEPEAAE
ncbi:MAG: hypothetical protein HDQ87_06950 [Clostridia bacterium]|nr:hypothetical protein [Clostridia bacterium]